MQHMQVAAPRSTASPSVGSECLAPWPRAASWNCSCWMQSTACLQVQRGPTVSMAARVRVRGASWCCTSTATGAERNVLVFGTRGAPEV